MLDIKQKIYSILSTLDLSFDDTPVVERKNYPYGLFRLNDKQITRYKNYKEVDWNFKIDIFSSYAGDKECLHWFDTIENVIFDGLMALDEVVHISTQGVILDDKEQGPVTKHGIFSIYVTTQEDAE